jgi:hypothetical protein
MYRERRLATVVLITLMSVDVSRCGAQDSEPEIGSLRRSVVYDVRFLTQSVPSFRARERPTAGALLLGDARLPGNTDRGSRGRGSVWTSLDADAGADGTEAPEDPLRGLPESDWLDAARLTDESLVELIRRNIAEDSWTDERNSIMASGGRIAISQTEDVHQAIDALLGSLRTRRARLYRIDIALVPPGALESEEIPVSQEPDADFFTRALTKAGAAGRTVSLFAYDEQVVSTFSGELSSAIDDLDPNYTRTATKPVRREIPTGLSVELEPIALGDSGFVELSVQIVEVHGTEPIETRSAVIADLVTWPLRESSLRSTALLKVGSSVVLGSLSTLDAEPRDVPSFAVLARIERVGNTANESPERAVETRPDAVGFRLAIHDIGFLLRRGSNDDREDTAGDLELLIRANVDPEAWRDERAWTAMDSERLLFVHARESTHAAVYRFLEEETARRGLHIDVELRVWESTITDAAAILSIADGGFALPDGFYDREESKRVREIARADLRILDGSVAKARAIRARRFLSRVVEETELSTNGDLSIVFDPELGSVGDGVVVHAVATSRGSRSEIDVEFSGVLATTDFRRTARRFTGFAASSDARGAAASGSPTLGTTAALKGARPLDAARVRFGDEEFIDWKVELPDQTLSRLRFRGRVPVNRPVIASIEPMGKGLVRIAILTARVEPAFRDAARSDPTAAPSPSPIEKADPAIVPPETSAETRSRPDSVDTGARRRANWDASVVGPPDFADIGPRVAGLRLRGLVEELIDWTPAYGRDSYDDDDRSQDFEPENLDGFTSLDTTRVADTIGAVVRGDSWLNARSSVAGYSNSVRVLNTPLVVAETMRFLDRLDSLFHRASVIEIAVVPLDAAESVRKDWTRPGSDPRAPSAAFELAVRAAGDEAQIFAVRAARGMSWKLSPRNRRMEIADHDLYVASEGEVATIADPETLSDGMYANACVYPAPGSRHQRVDLRVGVSRRDGDGERLRLRSGDLDLMRRSAEHFETTVLIENDTTLLVGVAETLPLSATGQGAEVDASRGRMAILLRARGSSSEVDASEPADDSASSTRDSSTTAPKSLESRSEAGIIDVSSLLARWSMKRDKGVGYSLGNPRARPASENSWDSEMETEPEAPAPFLESELIALIDAYLNAAGASEAESRLNGGFLFVDARQDVIGGLRAFLDRALRQRLALVRIDIVDTPLTVEELDRAQATARSTTTDRPEESPHPAAMRASIIGVAGRRLSASSFAVRSYVRDLEFAQRKDGTATRVRTEVDPIVGYAGSGLGMDVTVTPVPGTAWITLRVSGEKAREPRFSRTAEFRGLEPTDAAVASGTDEVPAIDPARIEHPDQSVDEFEHFATLESNRSVLLRVVPDAETPGRVRALFGHAMIIDTKSER